MDVLDQFIRQSQRLPLPLMSRGLSWLLAAIGIYLVAELTWQLIPTETTSSKWQPSLHYVGSGQNSSISLDSIEQLKLFGTVSTVVKAPVVEVKPQLTEAPKTTLSIQLTGVVASTAEQNGLAIIESRGNQETYSLGEKIKGTSASLTEVYADRIIISNNGRYETLMLDGLPYTTDSSANTQLQQATNQQKNQQKQTQRANDEVNQQLSQSRAALLEDPGKITDFIAISPIRKEGALAGYRLNPGKDKGLFAAAGFQANDLATSINGYDLTDMAQSIEVMAQLAELTEVSVMVERDGQLIEILFSLPQN